MPLTENEKTALADQLQLQADAGEPESLLATLTRFANRKANSSRTPVDEARRWAYLANALLEAEIKLNTMQSPERAKLDAHAKQWPAAELESATQAPTKAPTEAQTTPDTPKSG